MAAPKIDYEKVARILVSAVELGSDRQAAEHWKIAERTLRNYKRRLESDPELAAAFQRFSRLTNARIETERLQLELGWRRECHATLRKMLAAEGAAADRLMALLPQTTDVETVAKVAKLLAMSTERIGQLDVAREALGVGGSDHQPSPAPAEDAGGADEGADEEADRG